MDAMIKKGTPSQFQGDAGMLIIRWRTSKNKYK
jgi:hypothetical protein